MVDEGFKVWQRVLAQGSRITATSLQVLFDQDLTRGERFSRFLGDDMGYPDTRIFVDFSKQLIDQQALDELLVLAKDLQII